MAVTVALSAVFAVRALAGQGAGRMLYTVPNNTFIENISGDNEVTINDVSGSISTLQTLINNARAANPNYLIIIHLLSGATYWVDNNNGGLVLGSQECLVASGGMIEATNSAVTNTLITISTGSTNVSIAGGTLNGNGANIYCIYAPSSAAQVNIDKVIAGNCGEDCIQLNGQGDGTFNNEMTVTRCDVSGSPGHSGISIWNATQTTCVDNNCHGNSVGIWIGNGGFCNIANNTCESNSTGINCNSGSDNYVVNNTCNNNGTGIYVGGSGNMIVSDLFASNSIAAINSSGSGNIYCDNLFTNGNKINFLNNGSGDDVVAYQGAIIAANQNYFYPPLVNNQHNTTIINGMGRYDLYDDSIGPIDNVQSEYNAAVSANPGDVIVLHLNGSYTVGSNPLTLSSDTCILLGGTIQMSSSSASEAIYASGASYLSISGGTIDGGTTSSSGAGHDAIYFTGCSMFQIDGMMLQNFGTSSTRVGGSDVVRIDHGSTPRIFTRNTIVNGSARGFWLATSGVRDIVSDNTVTGVQMDGVDCDESTYASVIKNNYLSNNTRYGVFLEQSASDNLVIGNVCNYDASFDIGCYNNSGTPRGATEYNSIICNSLLGDNGLRNGSTGDGSDVTSSYNFFFDNTIMNANIQSQLYGSQNYYSQNYMGNSSISTSGAEAFFNSPDVSGNLYVQDSNSGLQAVVTNASTSTGAAVVLGQTNSLGSDQWSLVPTDSGYYRLMNKNSGLAMVVQGASTTNGAPIIQWTYNASGNDEWMPVSAGNGLYSFLNRLSSLDLDVPDASTSAGTQLDQRSSTGGANQVFNLMDAVPSVTVSTASNSVTWTSGGAPDGNWESPDNWGDVLPRAGDSLAFGTGSQVLTTNNFPAGVGFDVISFAANAPSFTLNGNGLILENVSQSSSGTFSGGSIVVNSIGNQTVNLPMTLSSGNHVIETAGGAGQLNFSSSLSRNAGALAQFSIGGGAVDTSLANVNNIIGGWAVVSTATTLVNNSGGAGTVNWAVNNGGAVAGLASYTTVTGSGTSIPNETGNNVDITSDGSSADTLGTSGVTDMNTLLFSASANNLQLNVSSGQILRLGAEGGILVNSPRYSTIGNGSSGTLTAGGGNNTPGELSLYNCSYYSGGGLVINAIIADNGAGYPVTVNTLGSVNLNFPDSYSGGTYINEGELYLQNGATFGSGPVYVLSGGRADLGGNNGATVANNFYIEGYGFGVGGEPGAIKGTYNGSFTGLITLLGNAQIDPNAGTWPNTCTFSGGFAGAGSLTIGGPSSVVAGVATFVGNCSYSGDTIVDATADADGGSGIYIFSGKNNILNNGGNLVLIGGSAGNWASLDLDGTAQTINALVATSGTIADALVTNSSSTAATLALGNNNTYGIFGGSIVNGHSSIALTKIGSGTQTLTGNNTYSGNTVISNGVLALSGSGSISNSTAIIIAADATLDASGLSDQTMTLNSGQTLEGYGTVNVNLAVNVGAAVAPGMGTNEGTLTVPGAAQLGGMTVMKLNASNNGSDQINASSFIYGGTLTVTNITGTLVVGQTFQLFLGESYAGAFSAINLPPLGAGLVWANNLAINGTLQVVASSGPRLTGILLSGTNLIINGTNGMAGEQYQLLSSTNLTLPLKQWVPVLTNNFDGNGNFNLTNTVNPAAPQNFYILQVP
ncbi:MAG TPA: RICIN domain-containing protein [Candidatus Acidoferrum sp.]|nr:RICIN domain-containing protein [Candidatus Acidoferrum sp.]